MTPTETALAWRERLTAMRPDKPPCPGITPAEWPEIRERALAFLEKPGQCAIPGRPAGVRVREFKG